MRDEMNPTTSQLLQSGLVITAWGMGIVFASLALLWALMRLLTSVFPDKLEPTSEIALPAEGTILAERQAAVDAALTVERAHVAAVIAGALLSNALPMEATTRPAFKPGRTVPSRVPDNRARAPQSWQSSRVAKPPHDHSRD